MNTTTAANRGSVTSKHLQFTSTYKHIKAVIAFVLILISAMGWSV